MVPGSRSVKSRSLLPGYLGLKEIDKKQAFTPHWGKCYEDRCQGYLE